MRPFTTLAIALFASIAAAHLARLFTGWSVVVEGWPVPTWVSLPGLAIAGGLAYMVWRESRRP
jgi:hypothetical protein